MAFTSCNAREDLIFSESAADRLTTSRELAADKLTADGGLWAMEYFTNSDESGYVILFRFEKDGSVVVSADHKWINGQFRQERSLWKMCSDNGTVLSFNSFNPIFHIFSDPADITGPYQPTNPETGKEYNETGYGHAGDYEFMVMKEDEHDMMRMLGKKTGYNIYMYRLPADTNEQEYLAGIKARTEIFNSKFKTFILTDKNGHEYEMSNMLNGVPSQFPRSVYDAAGNLVAEGDPVSQTTSKHGIFTTKGFRFSSAYTVKAADDTDWEMPELFWAEDSTLVNTELGFRLTATSAVENMNNIKFSWTLDQTTMTGKVLEAFNAANAACVAALGAKYKLGTVTFNWDMDNNKKMSATIVTRIGTKLCRDYYSIAEKKGENITNIYVDANTNGAKYNEQLPAYKAFKDILCSKYVLKVNNPMKPDRVHFSLASDPQSGFDITLD